MAGRTFVTAAPRPLGCTLRRPAPHSKEGRARESKADRDGRRGAGGTFFRFSCPPAAATGLRGVTPHEPTAGGSRRVPPCTPSAVRPTVPRIPLPTRPHVLVP